MAAKAKCDCGCGEAPASTTRLRRIACPCGASILRLSRAALQSIDATCRACGDSLEPTCLYDLTYTADADRAIAELETRQLTREVRNVITSAGRRAVMYRCGDCQRIRKAHGPCGGCGSSHPPTTSYMHPRAARVAGGDMPF